MFSHKLVSAGQLVFMQPRTSINAGRQPLLTRDGNMVKLIRCGDFVISQLTG